MLNKSFITNSKLYLLHKNKSDYLQAIYDRIILTN